MYSIKTKHQSKLFMSNHRAKAINNFYGAIRESMQFSHGFQQMLEIYRSVSNYKCCLERVSHYSTSNTNRDAIMDSHAI